MADPEGRANPEGDAERRSDALFEDAYAQLRAIAQRHFDRQPASHTLQPTALVHEVYLRLAEADGAGDAPGDQQHLLALASRAMRHALVDHARARATQKRGGGDWARVTLSGVGSEASDVDVLDLHEAIERLERLDSRQARIVEMRFFGGLTIEQVATALGISERTVNIDWQMARGWLWTQLQPGDRA